MDIEQALIKQIKDQFNNLQTKQDLVNLLNEVKKLIYEKDKVSKVSLSNLTFYANPKLSSKRYKTFTIKKKSGADRTIHAPAKSLKNTLRSINFILQCVYVPHKAATGFIPDKSITDNAKQHIGKNYVLNMDLKDFFHSFDLNRVKLAFMYEPFNLKKDREPLAFLLAALCTHPMEIDGETKRVLPQGSPASPTITNILCRRLDRRLTGLAHRFGATYTRYADDITFSSQHNIYAKDEKAQLNDKGCYDNFMTELERLIHEEKLTINPKKTRLQKRGYQQEVTGLIVNDKVNVRRKYVKEIRKWLYLWEKYSYEKAQMYFEAAYKSDKGHVKEGSPDLANVLEGKLNFMKMVKGEDNKAYEKLRSRFDTLQPKPLQQPKRNNVTQNINYILSVFASRGLEDAMNLFKKRI